MESESLERDSQSLNVSVRANKLCSEEQYTVIMTFGVRLKVTGHCRGQINATAATLKPGDSTSFSVDSAHISLRPNDEYCYFITGFSPDKAPAVMVCNDSPDKTPAVMVCNEQERDGLSTAAVVGLTLSLSLLVTLPVGVAIGGCAGVWCVERRRRRRRGDGGGGEKRELGVIYEEPAVPAVAETTISLSDNMAYGHLPTTRRR